jgi:osmoprotectant transport system ATP-binding protein
VIVFEHVTKRYPGGTVAVDDLSLEVPDGKIMILVGPSGCGKTTTLRMVNRLVEPTGGRILLDGRDVAQARPAALRRSIGYVIQQTGLFPHRTVEDNIATVPLLNGWRRARARARARELMDLVGLDAALARRYPQQLSGGQQQRVGVARALAADPPVLLMDEPFSAVDPVVRSSLQDELIRLQAGLRKTVVLVTHDVEEAIKVGDLVAVYRPGGHLAQVDTPERLLAFPADDYVEGLSDSTAGSGGFPSFPPMVLIWAWRRCSGSRPASPRRCRSPRAPASRGFWSPTQNVSLLAGLPPPGSSCFRENARCPASR